MSAAATQEVSTGLVAQPVMSRITSIDVFRGFTMAVMIFVNDLSDVRGLSRWTYHVPRDVNAMSYVDMVFPFFLFAVGISLPLAIQQRLRRDPSLARLWLHIVLRSLALIVLGLTLANVEHASKVLMHVRPSLWALLILSGAVAAWAVYPASLSKKTVLILRLSGGLLLLVMFVMFRSVDSHGHVGWLYFRYPEILGLVGLTYLAACMLYVPLRCYVAAPLACFAGLLLFNVACVAQWTSIDKWLPLYVFPFGNGAMPAITMAGVVVSTMFLHAKPSAELRRKMGTAFAFAFVCLTLGFVLRPLGISKIRATPTWSLWSIAAATATFAAFYYVCDVRQRTRWASLLRPAGSNTLLTYLLPDVTYFAISALRLNPMLGRWRQGLPGVVRSVGFTLAMLALSLLLTRRKVRLQL